MHTHTKTNKKCIEILYRPPLKCKDVVPSVVCTWLKPAVALESTSVPLFRIFLVVVFCVFFIVFLPVSCHEHIMVAFSQFF